VFRDKNKQQQKLEGTMLPFALKTKTKYCFCHNWKIISWFQILLCLMSCPKSQTQTFKNKSIILQRAMRLAQSNGNSCWTATMVLWKMADWDKVSCLLNFCSLYAFINPLPVCTGIFGPNSSADIRFHPKMIQMYNISYSISESLNSNKN